MRFFSFFFILLIASCSDINDKNENLLADDISCEWRVDVNNLKEGAPFPLVNEPTFRSVDDIDNLKDNDKAIVVRFKNEIRVYPYLYTDFSEVVNDSFLSYEIAISYCPQTKSGICFNRRIGDKVFNNLIASGYLLHDNLVISNHTRDFFWSQMLIDGIKGDLLYSNIESFFAIEMNWDIIKRYFNNAKVYYKDLTSSKFLNVKRIIKNVNVEKYFGVINNNKDNKIVSLYSYDYFTNLKIDTKNINQKETIIVGDKSLGFIVAFYVPDNVVFSVLKNDFPYILKDNLGRKWDVFGFNTYGDRLKSPSFFVAQLWAWNAFYSEVKIN